MTHEDHHLPDSIMLTEVAENSETFYVRIDGIHEVIDTAIDEHSLVNLNQTANVEILNDMIPVGQNDMGVSDDMQIHIDDKNMYQTIDANCMRIQVEHIENETTNIDSQQYFITSDCVVNK